jgi:biopolymer transport protein ExbB/TolQ
MKFSVATLGIFLALSSVSSTTAFAPLTTFVRPSISTSTRVWEQVSESSTVEASNSTEDAAATEQRRASKKDARLRMMKSEQFHRKGFKQVREQVEQAMGEQFQSEIVKSLRENDFAMEQDGVKVYLAKVR